jgi:hypothetical protein
MIPVIDDDTMLQAEKFIGHRPMFNFPVNEDCTFCVKTPRLRVPSGGPPPLHEIDVVHFPHDRIFTLGKRNQPTVNTLNPEWRSVFDRRREQAAPMPDEMLDWLAFYVPEFSVALFGN